MAITKLSIFFPTSTVVIFSYLLSLWFYYYNYYISHVILHLLQTFNMEMFSREMTKRKKQKQNDWIVHQLLFVNWSIKQTANNGESTIRMQIFNLVRRQNR